ncbi:MAG: nicotinamide-nucleotide amidohydrolase family protein [Desulfonatronovibrio sp.]
MWFEHNDKIVISMPGVPFEMKDIMQGSVLPRLKDKNGGGAIVHKTVHTIGIPESILAEKLEEWEDALPEFIHLAYLPNPGQIRLRFTALGNDETYLKKAVELEIEKLKTIIPEAIFGYDNDTLAGVVGKMLMDKNATVATAESCTGGQIAHSITSVPGSSGWFKASVVAYSNDVKSGVLKVNADDIEKHGAVSEQVVKQMAGGVRKLTNADYSVATSGIAGPDGGTDEKPVGTVWIAVASPDEIIAQKFTLSNNRERNIIRSSQTAFNMLRLVLVEE